MTDARPRRDRRIDDRQAAAPMQPPPRAAPDGADRAGQNIAGHALILVIAIMTFLVLPDARRGDAGARRRRDWENQISREATIQIKPVDGLDMEAALTAGRDRSPRDLPGVTGAAIVDREATARLLEPWLGTGLDHRRAAGAASGHRHHRHERSPPDFAAMRSRAQAEIPSASLDDHRSWVDRLRRHGAHARSPSASPCWC